MCQIDNLCINTIKILSAEMIEKANSGHPGLPLGAAPMAYALWAKQLKHNPKNPLWQNRDRFVLSAGHGSALLYSLLHLFGYGITAKDLQNFRQLRSKTPGHPEQCQTPGVEVTTGPLGQGIANAVGMAIAETYLANKFNRENYEIVNHYTFALCGDGCLMEGISYEAASLAGTLGLGKLILLYDSNNITIEGSTDLTFTENVGKRFSAFNWHVQLVEDGTDVAAIEKAIENAKAVTDKPSIIEIKTIIGHGSPNKQGKSSSHGEPLGADELVNTKKSIGWQYEDEFYVHEQVKLHFDEIVDKLAQKEQAWNELIEKYKKEHSELYKEWIVWHNKKLPFDLLDVDDLWEQQKNQATRTYSGTILNKIAKLVPNIIGGSADLASSTKTFMEGLGVFSKENRGGANIYFGIREHAMVGIANGIAIHGGLRPFVSGFFVFSDYMKPSCRLSALMKLPVINVFTHDSIGVGEDGPTHQPVEHLAEFRCIPNFTIIRPCDSTETTAAWCLALERTSSPTGIVLTRQVVGNVSGTSKNALLGGYVIKGFDENPSIILLASGSEVALVCEAYEILKQKGINARVVSMMSFEIFDEQSEQYKESVLPKNIKKRLAVEAASSFGWHKYVGLDGDVISVNSFGLSAPSNVLFPEYGFTVENVVKRAMKLLD